MSLQEKKIINVEEIVENLDKAEEPGNIKMKVEEIKRPQQIPLMKKADKKKVSYEDILSSLNMKVIDGKLQYIDKNAKPLTNTSMNTNTNTNTNTHNRQPIPLTREQYQQLVLENKRKRMESLRRVQQIKSTKMMFSNNNTHGISVSSSPSHLNRLFNFNR